MLKRSRRREAGVTQFFERGELLQDEEILLEVPELVVEEAERPEMLESLQPLERVDLVFLEVEVLDAKVVFDALAVD